MNWRYFALLLLVSSVSGCKTDKEVPTGDGGTDRVEFKQHDNVARIVLRAEPAGLNPLVTTQAMSRFVYEQIFQTLTEKDPVTFEQVPLLAGLPDVRNEEGGGVSYGYQLDPNATWPNGMPVTAEDVVFSLKALLNPLVNAGPFRTYYSMITNIVTSPGDEKRFRVLTKRPYVLAEEAIGSLIIYPEYAYDPDGLLSQIRLESLTNPRTAERLAETSENLKTFADRFNDPNLARDPELVVGSGPYRLVEWKEGQELRLAKREKYWAADRSGAWITGRPNELIFKIITDNNTIGNALRDELVDVVHTIEVDQFQEFREEEYLTDRFEFSTVPSFTYYAILLNQDDPLLEDVRVRRAFAHLVDVDLIIEQLFPGLAERVTGPLLPAKSYYEDSLEPIAYDVDRAKSLLAEAGWTDTNGDGTVDKDIDGEQRELSFQLLSFASPISEAVALIAAESAAKAGVDVEVIKQEPRALYGELNKGNFVASVYGQGFNPGPDELTQAWASTSVPPQGTNRGNFSNAEADRIIKQVAVTTDAAERDPLYRRFQQIVYENQPMIFLFSPSDRLVVSKRFSFTPTSLSPNLKFNDLKQQDWNKIE